VWGPRLSQACGRVQVRSNSRPNFC